MLYYEIILKSHQKLTSIPQYHDILEDVPKGVSPEKALCNYMETELEEYAQRYKGYYLKPSIPRVKKTEIKLLACCKYEPKRGFDLNIYLQKAFNELFKLKVSIVSVEELTSVELFHKLSKFIGESSYIDYSNDEVVSFSYVRHNGRSFDEHIYQHLTKEAILAEAQELMPDASLTEELQRIFSQDMGQFYGIPVHYKITAGTRKAAQKMIKILVQALYCSHRLLSSRTSFLFPSLHSNRMPFGEITNLAENNYGAVTVIELKPDSEEEDLFCESGQTEEIAEALERFKNHSQMIFVEIIGRQKGLRSCLSAIKKEVRLIEIKEGVGDAQDAEQMLMDFVKQSEFGAVVDFEAVKKDFFSQPNVCYNISSVYKAWQGFRDKALVSGLYTQYKPLLSTKLEQGAQEEDVKSPYSKFNRMIGLNTVKQTAKKIIATFKVQKKRQDLGLDQMSFSRHMLFTGNPGTAKTTVARLMAQIFAKEGITPAPTFVECGRSDVVGQYVGQTAVKVKQLFEKAKGGVLFIDEAYSLVDGYRGYYGDEAINTIVQEMENNREDTIVIFAGYPMPMQKFLDANEGLRSRIGFHLDFPDYNAAELQQILELMLEEREYTLSEEAKAKSLELFEAATQQSDFGNGRYVRNLLEQMIMQQSLRIFDEEKDKVWDKDSISMITDADIPSNMLPLNKKEKRGKTIGFNCA